MPAVDLSAAGSHSAGNPLCAPARVASGVAGARRGLACAMSGRGDDAELLHKAKQVTLDPLFRDLAGGDPVDVSAGNAGLLPRGRDALELAFMLEPIGIVDDDHVVLRYQEFGRVVDIEGSEVSGDQLLECLASADWSRDTTDTADVVRTAEFIDDVRVPFVPELVLPAQHELLVFPSGHCFALLSGLPLKAGHNVGARPRRWPGRLARRSRRSGSKRCWREGTSRCSPMMAWSALRTWAARRGNQARGRGTADGIVGVWQ